MMKRITARAIARRGISEQQDFVAWWATTLWVLGAVYLLITFELY